MKYIIDANNLAGSLKLLSKRDFDQVLISLLKDFFYKRKSGVTLVFDGCCQFGDHFQSGILDIYYAGRHQNFGAADDKIVELIERYIHKEAITLVTDDIELTERAKLVEIRNRKPIEFIKASFLAKKIMHQFDEVEEIPDKKIIDGKIERQITEELLKLWVK